MAPALEVTDLTTHINLSRSVVQAVGNVDLQIEAGETLGLVGESGCGKSMLGLSRSWGCSHREATSSGGSIKVEGRELVGSVRGRAARDPGQHGGHDLPGLAVLAQSDQDGGRAGGRAGAPAPRRQSRKEALERALEVLELVGLPQPKERLKDYPHQLSGGLRQRVMIAIALSCEPRVLLADEPTTALDVTIQSQILALLDDLKDRLGMATLLVTHDMGVVAGRTKRINVMYAGRIVETAPTGRLFRGMRHPYTQGLLGSIPRLDQDNREALVSIPGLPPDLTNPPLGCRFAPRCPRATGQVPGGGAAADRGGS